MDKEQNNEQLKRVLLCIVLSICVHIVTVLLLLSSPRQAGENITKGAISTATPPPPRYQLRLLPPQQQQQKQHPFAKTSVDAQQPIKPPTVDFEGKHNTKAAGDNSEAPRSSEAPLPTMQGEEKDEIVTFDQERQDGNLEHEGKRDTKPTSPLTLEEHSLQQETSTSTIRQGATANKENHHTNLGTGENNTAPQTTHTAKIPEPNPEGETLLQTRVENTQKDMEPSSPSANLGRTDGLSHTTHMPSLPNKQKITVFDPSLADHAQPVGFRTRERRSRSTGRFVMGRKPSLNVAATPRGRYEAEIYRRIARIWYETCDEHRGDIIPGTIVISLRIDKKGYLRNMQLISRRGAGVIQQSFTLGAIRRATLPPMPAQVAANIVGDIMELIIEFNFD